MHDSLGRRQLYYTTFSNPLTALENRLNNATVKAYTKNTWRFI